MGIARAKPAWCTSLAKTAERPRDKDIKDSNIIINDSWESEDGGDWVPFLPEDGG